MSLLRPASLLAAALLPFPAAAWTAVVQDPSGIPPRAVQDTLVDIGGRSLHLRVYPGATPLTVLFEAGGGADLGTWGEVPRRLAARTDATVVAYDRAGLGMSDLGPLDLTPRQEIADVRVALGRLGLPERAVVVGHSYGGLLALAHAEMFSNRTVGLVLVDPMNPRFVARLGEWLKTTVPDIPDPRTDREQVLLRMSRSLDALSADLLRAEPELEQPMVIISAGSDWWGRADADSVWRRTHAEMAAVSPGRRRLVATGTGHDIPGERPELVVGATLELIRDLPSSR